MESARDGFVWAQEYSRGKPTTKVIRTGFVTVTKANINQPAVQNALYKSSC